MQPLCQLSPGRNAVWGPACHKLAQGKLIEDRTVSLTRRVSRKLECKELVLWEPKRVDRL